MLVFHFLLGKDLWLLSLQKLEYRNCCLAFVCKYVPIYGVGLHALVLYCCLFSFLMRVGITTINLFSLLKKNLASV